jgi:hypothetical protein
LLIWVKLKSILDVSKPILSIYLPIITSEVGFREMKEQFGNANLDESEEDHSFIVCVEL